MPGFVDVGNMSDLEIKRMGQMDDDIDFQPRRSYSRRNPQGYTNANRPAKPASARYTVSDVWAAACAAQRVNGGYFKEFVYDYSEGQAPQIVKRRNRDLMMQFLDNPTQLTVDDVERGEHCRQFLQSDLTFRTLKGKVSEFDTAIRKVLAVQDQFDSYINKYELAIVASLPASVERSETRQNSDQRIQFAQGGLVGQVGDKVQLNVEVISAVYSQQYNIFWIRAITDQDQAVYFSNKEKFDVGTHFTVQGKVKAHKDNLTQLNYVKVL